MAGYGGCAYRQRTHLGPPARCPLHIFWGRVPLTKIDYRKKGTLILTSPLEDPGTLNHKCSVLFGQLGRPLPRNMSGRSGFLLVFGRTSAPTEGPWYDGSPCAHTHTHQPMVSMGSKWCRISSTRSTAWYCNPGQNTFSNC